MRGGGGCKELSWNSHLIGVSASLIILLPVTCISFIRRMNGAVPSLRRIRRWHTHTHTEKEEKRVIYLHWYSMRIFLAPDCSKSTAAAAGRKFSFSFLVFLVPVILRIIRREIWIYKMRKMYSKIVYWSGRSVNNVCEFQYVQLKKYLS